MSYEKSPIDEFFRSLYGFYPSKAGQSYELLVNSALKLLNRESTVFYDQHIKGQYSGQYFQIDGILGDKSVEAKDYTIRNDKVGRPDVQNQEGALVDLPFREGVFSSATGYTRNAKMYAKGTIENPVTKKIELYNIRPSTLEDEEGRVETVVLDFSAVSLNFERALFNPSITKDGMAALAKLFPEGEVSIKVDSIYNDDGSIFMSMKDWTKSLNSEVSLDDEKTEISGKTDFHDKYIKVNNTLIGIDAMSYKVPIQKLSERIEIKQDGKACLYVKNEDGSVDTLLTDVQMKSISFDESTKEVKQEHGT